MREALLAKWFKKCGEMVKRDDSLCEIETDKITLDLNADADGVLSITVAEGTTVAVGTAIGVIDEAVNVPDAPVVASAPLLAKKLADPASSPSIRQGMKLKGVTGLHIDRKGAMGVKV